MRGWAADIGVMENCRCSAACGKSCISHALLVQFPQPNPPCPIIYFPPSLLLQRLCQPRRPAALRVRTPGGRAPRVGGVKQLAAAKRAASAVRGGNSARGTLAVRRWKQHGWAQRLSDEHHFATNEEAPARHGRRHAVHCTGRCGGEVERQRVATANAVAVWEPGRAARVVHAHIITFVFRTYLVCTPCEETPRTDGRWRQRRC